MSHNQFISKSYLSILMQENDYDAMLRAWHNRSGNEMPPTDKTAQWAFNNYLSALDKLDKAVEIRIINRTIRAKRDVYKEQCHVNYWKYMSILIDSIITHPRHQSFIKRSRYIFELDGGLPHHLLKVVDVEGQLLEIT